MKPQLIVFPLKKEMQLVLQDFRSNGYLINEKKSSSGVSIMEIQKTPWIFAVGGHGKVQCGVTTQHLISEIKNLNLILCAGSGGSLSEKVLCLDIVLGRETVEHDYKQVTNPKASRPRFRCDGRFMDRAQSFRGSEFALHIGTIASGDEDIISLERAAELHQQTGALAVGWEGAGVAKAARWNHIPFAEIRAITDRAQDNVIHDFKKNFPIAMKHLAQYLKFMSSTTTTESE